MFSWRQHRRHLVAASAQIHRPSPVGENSCARGNGDLPAGPMNRLAVFHLPEVHITLKWKRRFDQMKCVWIGAGKNRLPERISQELFPLLSRCLFLTGSVARDANSAANHGIWIGSGNHCVWVRPGNRRRRGSRLRRRVGECRWSQAAIARRRRRCSGVAEPCGRIPALPVRPLIQKERNPGNYNQEGHEGEGLFHSHLPSCFRAWRIPHKSPSYLVYTARYIPQRPPKGSSQRNGRESHRGIRFLWSLGVDCGYFCVRGAASAKLYDLPGFDVHPSKHSGLGYTGGRAAFRFPGSGRTGLCNHLGFLRK